MARSSSTPKPSKSAKKPESTDPLLTQKNFEQELKSLASKAKEETWSKWATEQALVLLRAGTLLSLSAIYSNASQLTLSPIYGSIPASIWHSQGVMTACFLGWSLNLVIRRRSPVKPVTLLPLIAAYIPMVQFFMFKIGGFMGAVYGPIITEAVTFFPLLLLSVASTATALDDLDMTSGRFPWLVDALPGMSSYAFYKTMEHFSGKYIQQTIGSTFIHTRLGLEILLAGLYSIFAPSKLLLFALPAVLHTAIFNYHVPHATSWLNDSMTKTGWSLIDRQESLTGYVSIIESAEHGFKVMRCDHSLLGGEWVAHQSPNGLTEPIYGVFVMLEAVRLVKVSHPVPEEQPSALVIGLGIGTTPAAFITHGIDTTIVEIDPAVHSFATKYFALPPNHTPVIADAVSYASETAKEGKQYTYIVHDVFTGGAEPVDLFTLEFIQDLHAMLAPWGVIAINYAGDLTLPSSLIVIRTIKTVFPRCRIYRESPAPPPEQVLKEGRDFTNMVIFCTKESSNNPIRFRNPTEADFLSSRAREMFLLPQHEVDESAFEKSDGSPDEMRILRKNETQLFTPWLQKSALGHWAVMRTVIPPEIWEQW